MPSQELGFVLARVVGIGAALGACGLQVVVGQTPSRGELEGTFIEIVPVDPLGSEAAPYPPGTVIDGNTITVPAGTRVWLDVYFGGWAPYLFDSNQIVIDTAGFASGPGAPLVIATESCTVITPAGSPECEPLFGIGSSCFNDEYQCNPAVIDPARLQPPFDVSFIKSTFNSLTTIGFGFIKSPFTDLAPDAGVPYLIGSFVVDVPADGRGTYTIMPLTDQNTFLCLTEVGCVSFEQVTPAVLTVYGGCCLPDNTCADITRDACVASGGTGAGRCWGDCNGDGIDDGCQGALDCNENGIADFCDRQNGFSRNCNRNVIPDECELADGAEDCNNDTILDECQLVLGDCNGNGILDECEPWVDCDSNGILDSCDIASGNATDCNANGVLDSCDIADGTSLDADGNCIPDECDQLGAPLAEINGLDMSRFVVLSPASAGCRPMAIRVSLNSLTPPGVGGAMASFEGESRWVGPPFLQTDVTSEGTLFQTLAQLQCDPHVQDWSTVGLIHVYGAAVMPESRYEVDYFDVSCGDEGNPACFSPILPLTTCRWGDTAPPYASDPGAPVQPDPRDIAAVVDKFLGQAVPSRPVVDLDPNVLNAEAPIDFRDIATAVSAFLEEAYAYEGPQTCP